MDPVFTLTNGFSYDSVLSMSSKNCLTSHDRQRRPGELQCFEQGFVSSNFCSQREQKRLICCMHVSVALWSRTSLFTNLIGLHIAILVVELAVIVAQCTTSISSKFCAVGVVFRLRNFFSVLNSFFSSPFGFLLTSCSFSFWDVVRFMLWMRVLMESIRL